MSELLDPKAPVAMPAHWVSAAAGWSDVSDASTALRTGEAHIQVRQHSVERASAFDLEFWTRLQGTSGHVVIDVLETVTSLQAVTLVAAWMGLPPSDVHDDVGGTVSHVLSGVGHRHDQSWHTDSTPWREPNRYSVLGLLAGEEAEHHSTDLLALASLYPALASDPGAWGALRNEPIEWRRNFPQLPELPSPILGVHQPRWVWPVLESQLDDFSVELRRGVTQMSRLINEVPYHSPVVSRSRVLVFDNWRMLHRGPQLDASSGRELIRVKVAGKAIA